MIANATGHRRANAFAQALDARPPAPDDIDGTPVDAGPSDQARRGGTTAPSGAQAAVRHADPAQGRMLALAEGLGRMAPPEFDPEVKAVQRAQLMAAMETAFAGGKLDPEKVVLPGQRDRRQRSHRAAVAARLGKFRPRSRWGRRLAASGLAMTVAASGLGAAAAASSDALPGDTLYGLKRGMEDLRLTMADDDTDRGQVLLDLASTRLKEARRLLERSKAGPLDDDQISDVRRALAGIQEEAAEGHRLLSDAYRRSGSLDPIQALASFTDEHQTHWSRLSDQLPSRLAPERERVASVFNAIEQDVTPLRPLLPEPDDPTGRPGAHRGDTGSPGSVDRPDGAGPRGDSGAPGEAEGQQKGGGQGSGSSEAPSADDDGLLGDGGLLDPPPPHGSTPPQGGTGSVPNKEVTLPPLLPGLLPGIGIDGDDEDD